MPCPGNTLQDLLVSARKHDCLTVGVYESAKVMNGDPDSVAFCVLANDEEFECDVALQIHFTLIQAFCFDNDISIVRVNDMQQLFNIVGDKSVELEDAHCVLITQTSAEGSWQKPALEKLHLFCAERHSREDWMDVPLVARTQDLPNNGTESLWSNRERSRGSRFSSQNIIVAENGPLEKHGGETEGVWQEISAKQEEASQVTHRDSI